MPTVFDSHQAEIIEVENSLDTFGHKARRVLSFYRAEIQRTFNSQLATVMTFERIGLHRLMCLRLLSQLLDRRSSGESMTADDRHLIQLLFSAERHLAGTDHELEDEFGPLDFSGRVPELFSQEFGIDINDAHRDAVEIQASRAFAEAHRAEILARVQKVGLL